jgi:predicted enzyme related to lactoylglutathione lyase
VSKRDEYPAGVPCWVVNLQPDPAAAADFYGHVFGWDITPEDGGFLVARLGGREVAAIAPAPDGVAPAWITHVRTDSAERAAADAGRAGGTVVAGPLDMGPTGKVAVLRDPTGAVFNAWEAGTREGAQTVNEPSAWAMSELKTPEPGAATEFYGALFGWDFEPFGPPEAGIQLMRLPGYVGGEPSQPVPRDVVAVMFPAAPSEAARWSPGFWIADADAAAERAAERGGAVLEGPMDSPPFREAVLADPAGAAFTISQLTALP